MGAQLELETVRWPGAELRGWMGLHLSGEADERGGDYFGAALSTAARVAAASHGGQVAREAVLMAAQPAGSI